MNSLQKYIVAKTGSKLAAILTKKMHGKKPWWNITTHIPAIHSTISARGKNNNQIKN